MNGWIAELDNTHFSHCFGGHDWIVCDPEAMAGGPTLLLCLDLDDPRLDFLAIEGLKSLPICSYINCDLWIEPQHYEIKPDSKQLVLLERSNTYTTILDATLSYPNPLPRKSISLREMNDVESGQAQEDYWKACDTFLGTSSFIRILGKPLWLQRANIPHCGCGIEQTYICSIGYDYPELSGLIEKRSFFIGEAALYFFLCKSCKILTVISQPT